VTNIIQLSQRAAKLYDALDKNIVVSLETITPESATNWLRANQHNRPVRRRHVAFLAQEIIKGNWQVNGQPIVISEREEVLDGQHRLMAIIEAGRQIQSLVVYGIEEAAFKTIDTGAVRTGADALTLEFPEASIGTMKAASTAVVWCKRLEDGRLNNFRRVSNTETIEYVKQHPSLIQCIERVQSYPHDNRPLSIGCGGALFEMFARRSSDLADDYMHKLYTGEAIGTDNVEWHLRAAFIRDANSRRKLPTIDKVRMVVKGWTHRRRALPTVSPRFIQLRPDDPAEVKIL
jgi:hypothetical protein